MSGDGRNGGAVRGTMQVPATTDGDRLTLRHTCQRGIRCASRRPANSDMALTIRKRAPKPGRLDLGRRQPVLPLVQRERGVDGLAMGVLSDGTLYLNQRGLAALCGVRNAHIGTISSQWNDPRPKPRIQRIRAILGRMGVGAETAHIEVVERGRTHFCYPADICLAVLEYYAFDAGMNVSETARDNFRALAASKLREAV